MKKSLTQSPTHFTSRAIIAGLALIVSSWAAAQFEPSPQNISTHLQSMFAGKDVTVKDYDEQLKEVDVGTDHFFVSHDGRYVFAGPVYDTHRQIDIVAEQQVVLRKELLSAQPKSLFIGYPSIVKEKHRITVVTDIDCPYCRKFHDSLSLLNQQGISVNYLMMPRAGTGSASYAKTLNALCSSDPAGAITQAMSGKIPAPAAASCNTEQLSAQVALAQKMKIRSTPTFVFPTGELQVGLLNTEHLLRVLDNLKPQQ